jgi:GYF domain 2
VRFPAGPASWEDAVPDPVPSDPDWFVLLQAKQVGPLDARALVERVRTGEVHGRTFVWRDGFDGWRRALEVPELIPVLEDAGFPTTPTHGPLTPSDGLLPPASRTPGANTPSRTSTPGEIAPVRRRPAPKAKLPEDEELELSRVPRRGRGRPLPPESDYLPSGLTRKSPWKLALALSAALALPVGGLAVLVWLRHAPAVEAHGEAQAEPPSASEPAPVTPVRRVQELRDLLLGKKAAPAPAPASPTPGKHSTPEAKSAPKAAPDTAKTAELRALYGDASKPDVGPRVRRAEGASAPRGGGAPSNEEVARVVGQTQSAFQSCIEQQLRKNPGFRGGKVSLLATVGSSGTVKQVQLDRHDLEGTDLGNCLKARAHRMVFSAFSGDDVDVEIPLVLTTTL